MWIRRLLRTFWNVRQYFAPVTMGDEESIEPMKKKIKLAREFDFTKYAKRHVLFMVSYLGWDYNGLVFQSNIDTTVEDALHAALIKTRLVQSIENARYNRCGRTDKGVSAFRQVVSLDVRTLTADGEGVFIPDGHTSWTHAAKRPGAQCELNYIDMLNRVLPEDIRVLAWAPAPLDHSARYHCTQRTYKYFFPRGDINIEAMRDAGQRLIGTHDLRNFCKFDLSKNRVKDTMRTITSVTIEEADVCGSGSSSSFDMFVLTISAPAFLWHQIRNIVTVLVLVGRGKEEPDVVSKLMDVETHPRKPQYGPAYEVPLILYDCAFDNVKWTWDRVSRQLVLRNMQRQWTELAAKAQMLKSMCEDLAREAQSEDPTFPIVADQALAIQRGDLHRTYKPLLKRPVGSSMEEMQVKCVERATRREEARAKGSDESDSG